MSTHSTEEARASSACLCGHRAEWHHDVRGCDYHGAGPHKCPCERSCEAVIESIVAERLAERMSETCREWLEGDISTRCHERAAFIIWGKLSPREALGPRCYAHAVDHLGFNFSYQVDQWAVFDLRTQPTQPTGGRP